MEKRLIQLWRPKINSVNKRFDLLKHTYVKDIKKVTKDNRKGKPPWREKKASTGIGKVITQYSWGTSFYMI